MLLSRIVLWRKWPEQKHDYIAECLTVQKKMKETTVGLLFDTLCQVHLTV